MSHGDALQRELTTVGITGKLRARIVTEIDDHLECNPAADLGTPAALAAQFADELGTNRARRAAGRTFAALALAGLLFGVAFIGGPAAAFGAAPAGAPLLGKLARIAAVLAPQVAFAAGVLAALRAVRRRRTAVIPAAEVRIILRRASIGTAAGVVTMASLGVIALVFHTGSSTWYSYARIASIVGIVALVATVPSLLAARRLRSVLPGDPGDIFDDLGGWVPEPLRGHPWRLAVMVAAGIAIALALAGLRADDFYDGIARGVVDAMACLIGFATLGRYLGLWAPATR